MTVLSNESLVFRVSFVIICASRNNIKAEAGSTGTVARSQIIRVLTSFQKDVSKIIQTNIQRDPLEMSSVCLSEDRKKVLSRNIMNDLALDV